MADDTNRDDQVVHVFDPQPGTQTRAWMPAWIRTADGQAVTVEEGSETFGAEKVMRWMPPIPEDTDAMLQRVLEVARARRDGLVPAPATSDDELVIGVAMLIHDFNGGQKPSGKRAVDPGLFDLAKSVIAAVRGHDVADTIEQVVKMTEERLAGGEFERRREAIMDQVRGSTPASEHRLTVKQLPQQPRDILDWWCTCKLIAGHDLFTLDEAITDATVVHRVQEGVTLFAEPAVQTSPVEWTVELAPRRESLSDAGARLLDAGQAAALMLNELPHLAVGAVTADPERGDVVGSTCGKTVITVITTREPDEARCPACLAASARQQERESTGWPTCDDVDNIRRIAQGGTAHKVGQAESVSVGQYGVRLSMASWERLLAAVRALLEQGYEVEPHTDQLVLLVRVKKPASEA